jgi:aminopeptidase N
MSTTHPVRSVVANTGVASVIFDSITYRKGSMTLKQLKFLMGEDNFFKGLKDYFVIYGYKNATVKDFLDCMSNYFYNSDFTLDDWR